MMSQRARGLVLIAAAVAVTGCQELIVPNLNDPDRFSAQSDPSQLELLGAGMFENYFRRIQYVADGAVIFQSLGSALSWGTTFQNVNLDAAQPRPPYPNVPASEGSQGPRNLYSSGGTGAPGGSLLGLWSAADDMIRAFDPDALGDPLPLIQNGVDAAPRLVAYAYTMQGLALGAISGVFERATAIRSTEPLPETQAEQAAVVKPALDVLMLALENFEKAKAILVANPTIAYPAWTDLQDPMTGLPLSGADLGRWFGQAVSADLLIRYINTSAARYIIHFTRSPADRATLPHYPGGWQALLDNYLSNGLMAEDFAVPLSAFAGTGNSFRFSNMQSYMSGSTTSTVTAGAAVNPMLYGQADTLGSWQDWSAFPDPPEVGRAPFLVETPDRRVTGVGTITTAPAPSGSPYAGQTVFQAPGAYFRVHVRRNCCFQLDYWTGSYQWRRKAHEAGVPDPNMIAGSPGSGFNGNGLGVGFHVMASADQNRLYMAEAYYRLGQLANARDMVNVTRTRDKMVPNHQTGALTAVPGLPPATVDGAPHSGTGPRDCVPKRPTRNIVPNGDCGDLLTAIIYERLIELLAYDVLHAYMDSRGFGMLVNNTVTEWPLPVVEANLIGEVAAPPRGGPGDPTSAVYAPVGSGWDGVP